MLLALEWHVGAMLPVRRISLNSGGWQFLPAPHHRGFLRCGSGLCSSVEDLDQEVIYRTLHMQPRHCPFCIHPQPGELLSVLWIVRNEQTYVFRPVQVEPIHVADLSHDFSTLRATSTFRLQSNGD